MGCDIHLHQEVKLAGKWHHYALHSVPRNYELFGMMAGVRRREEQLFPVKPWPDDVTFVTLHDWVSWIGNAHTKSWLDKEEIHRLNEHRGRDLGAYVGYCFGSSWDYSPKADDVRFIFWFDN